MTTPFFLWAARRDLRHYRAHFLFLMLAGALSAAVVGAAGVAGSSLNAALRANASERLGRVAALIASTAGAISPALRSRVDAAAEGRAESAVILALNGFALREGHEIPLKAYGVDERFFRLAPGPRPPGALTIADGEAFLNHQAAQALGVEPGVRFAFRVQTPAVRAGEWTLSGNEPRSRALSCRAARIVGPEAFGSFRLVDGLTPEAGVFVSLRWLSASVGRPDRGNRLLAAAMPPLDQRLVPFADTGLLVAEAGGGRHVVQSEGYFLNDAAAARIHEEFPQGEKSFAYLANAFISPTRQASHGFVLGVEAAGLPDGGIAVNESLAAQLGVGPGDPLTLRGLAGGGGSDRREAEQVFTVARVIPMETAVRLWRPLVPAIPGLTEKANCREWDAGFGLDLSTVTPVDEAYWRDYGVTPKAVVSRDAARRLWPNRFGFVSAVAIPAARGEIADRLENAWFTFGEAGLSVEDPRPDFAAEAGQGRMFAVLFLGLGSLAILGGLYALYLLQSLYFSFRRPDIESFIRMGFSRRGLYAALFPAVAASGLLGAAAGGLLGAPLAGWLTTRALNGVWNPIASAQPVAMVVEWPTLLAACAAGGLVNIVSGWLCLRSVLNARAQPSCPSGLRTDGAKQWLPGALLLLAALAPAAVLPYAESLARHKTALYLASGALLLAALLALWRAACRLSPRGRPRFLFVPRRHIAARRRESFAIVSLLALGVFIVLIVGLNRMDIALDDASVGGYDVVMETSLPVVLSDLSLDARARAGALPARVAPGAEVDCALPNSPRTPAIVAFDPETLEKRRAFRFAAFAPGVAHQNWRALEEPISPGAADGIGESVEPVAADAEAMEWIFRKKPGDDMLRQTPGKGAARLRFQASLRPSVLQNALLMAESRFLRLFPDSPGHALFLVEDAVVQEWREKLRPYGVVAERCSERLERFGRARNCYLAVFFHLGFLGLALAGAGSAIALARNLREHREDEAMLAVIGFSRGQLFRIRLWECAILWLSALAIGTAASLYALAPTLDFSAGAGNGHSVWLGLPALWGVLLAGGLISAAILARSALPSPREKGCG